MKQLPMERVMKRLLKNSKLTADDLKRLAYKLVEFYQTAATGGPIDDMGAVSVIEKNCKENFEQTDEFKGTILDSNIYDGVRQSTYDFLKRWPQRFIKRTKHHKIRDGHGDLRVGHIYFTADQIQIIDCIEFNQRFRYVDIIGDLAFLLMDMDYIGCFKDAQTLFKFYLTESKDTQCVLLLSFYKCYRAMVRVKVNCLRLGQDNLAEKDRLSLANQTRHYLSLAYRYAEIFNRPSIWVVCGLIAAGKSTIAAALAKVIEAEVFSSDRIRKTLAPLSGTTAFGKGLYTEEFTRSTYDKLKDYALRAIRRRDSVVLDATYGNRLYRAAIVELAKQHQTRIVWIECRCPEPLIRSRLKERETISQLDSDARIEHLEPIKAKYSPLQEVDPEDIIRINTQEDVAANLLEILARFM